MRFELGESGFEEKFTAFLSAKRENDADLNGTVAQIIADVRKNGDTALFDYTKRFDQVELTSQSIRVSEKEIEEAVKSCKKETLDALYLAAERIEAFHEKQIPESRMFNDETGALLGWRWTPVFAAGLYVPGGTAAYPSSVLMNAVPAKVAGVKRIVMAVPAPQGKINPLVLAAADCVGIDEIYRIGGTGRIPLSP